MAGVKGMKGSGGQRKGAGPPQQIFKLDRDTAKKLRILLLDKKELQPDITGEQVISLLVNNAWYDLDQHWKESATVAIEGENEYLEKGQ